MMLLEFDAKKLLNTYGILSPKSILVNNIHNSNEITSTEFPCFIKAQIPVGGRGKSGCIKRANNGVEFQLALDSILGHTFLDHTVSECLVEQLVKGHECYISLLLDPVTANVNILVSEHGGLDVEQLAKEGSIYTASAKYNKESVKVAFESLLKPSTLISGAPFFSIGARLIDIFFDYELILAEINPLFILPDGSCQAGDAKIVCDDNAIERIDALMHIVKSRPHAYPDITRKLACGFDFVPLNAQGEVALLTTGAGLSMQLIDELMEKNCSPLNFCDIRTGQFKGKPDRLIQALSWILSSDSIKVILLNFFAGVTDLEELATLIVMALKHAAPIKVPVVVRLIGHKLAEAKAILKQSDLDLYIESDLELAIDLVSKLSKSSSIH